MSQLEESRKAFERIVGVKPPGWSNACKGYTEYHDQVMWGVWQAAVQYASHTAQESRGEVVTVREAFALAGYPVPEGAKIVRWGEMGTWIYDTPTGWSSWLEDEQTWAAEAPPIDYGWHSDFYLSIAALPATDAYKALPPIVQAALLAHAQEIEGAEPKADPTALPLTQNAPPVPQTVNVEEER